MHPANTFINTFTKMFPILALGMDRDVMFGVAVTSLVISYVSHANIDARTGWLDYVIATPRVHHCPRLSSR